MTQEQNQFITVVQRVSRNQLDIDKHVFVLQPVTGTQSHSNESGPESRITPFQVVNNEPPIYSLPWAGVTMSHVRKEGVVQNKTYYPSSSLDWPVMAGKEHLELETWMKFGNVSPDDPVVDQIKTKVKHILDTRYFPPQYSKEVFKLEEHPDFKNFTPSDCALWMIEQYGQIDGSHHKTWVLDQVSRILKGTKVEVHQTTYVFEKPEPRVEIDTYLKVTDPPSDAYLQWRKEMVDEDGDELDYDEGISP